MFELIKSFYALVSIFFLIYLMGYSTFLFVSVIAGSVELYQTNKRKRYQIGIEHNYYVPISIIVPAYNEEITVVDTVKSLLLMDYQRYEIIIVDDGSRDRTTEVLLEAFDMHELNHPIKRHIPCKKERRTFEAVINDIKITLVQKDNGGKADSLNMGINVCAFPYFICMDADSILQKDSLREIASPLLESDDVVAVGGLVRISNYAKLSEGKLVEYVMPWNPVVGMQILEYDRSFMASRIFMDKFQGNLIISGAFGLFNREAVTNVGGYDATTMGEDMELVVKLHTFCQINKIPYEIRYAPDAICWSQCPASIADLRKQRRRWYLGLFQCLYKYRVMFLSREFGPVGYLSYIYYLIYELLSPFIEVFGFICMIAAYLVDLVDLKFMMIFFMMYALYGSILTLTAFFARIYTQNITLTILDVVKAVYLCVAESIVLRFIQALTRVTAFVGYQKRKNVWGQIKRQKINFNQSSMEMEKKSDEINQNQ